MFQDLNPLDRSTAILEIAIMLLGAAIIGFVLAWVLRKRPVTPPADSQSVDALKAEIAELKRKLAAMPSAEAQQQELGAVRQALQQAQAEAARQATAATERIQTLEKENASLRNQPQPETVATEALKQQRLAAQTEAEARAAAEAKLQAAQAQLQAQAAEIKALQAQAKTTESPEKEMDWLRREKDDLERDVRDLEERIDRLERENSDLRAQARDKQSAGPTIDKLTRERDRLKQELDRLKKAGSSLPAVAPDFSHLGPVDPLAADDLLRINGIGPVIATRLNQIGIFNYRQLSNMTDADIATLDEALQLFPGRVKREDWIGQAKTLLMKNEE